MTEQEQRIAIAEACGAKWHWTVDNSTQFLTFKDCDGEYVKENETSSVPRFVSRSIPDYPNDLNAMHEAEKILVERGPYSNEWRIMESMLARIIPSHVPLFHATAQQRAEAFLRTIGKWKE